MTRRRLSQALAAFLGGASPLFVVAVAAGPDCDGQIMKTNMAPVMIDVTGVKVNVNAGGANAEAAQAPGMDSSAGQKGATEYEGRAIKCVPVEGTDKVYCSSGGE